MNNLKLSKVRLNNENGKLIGIFSLNEALLKSEELNLDLVEINSNTTPPICKLMNYGKFLYKKKRIIKKKNNKILQIKEIKFRPVTNNNDYIIKTKKIIKFLKNGNKTKITIKFKGRETIHKNLGENILERIKKNICDNLKIAIIESFSKKLENQQLLMILAPKNNSI
ncbi:translation initiation factor IF-3 [Enterobacteriaceae bacterium ET-AT1-13]|nr:translation initiation factor IF-3 [Enterobacteriaceae bacterium ET-AT1-13]WGS66527.1 translation initiation factor IF-3 [Enterobacteriaceae bacterium Cmel17]WMC17553.1 MAG: translation initiation factor IF-3 [Enterobacteriaceae bacterium Cmel21]WMC17757.1 MAG: translation initiation factor IF-3 [Enterobacteriaceae bacterium PSmelAO3-2]WMC17961.1 MAG: translation initiation factor IF-3 [Enterobacteriaceae bacterium PSmelAO3-1]WMC18163.1 MAG: translation initiation factor IF-3 [Enterobacteri